MPILCARQERYVRFRLNTLLAKKPGDHGTIDGELLTAVREYKISWDKDDEISAELAKLRWEKKWIVKKIAEHLDLSYDSVNMRLRRLARAHSIEC